MQQTLENTCTCGHPDSSHCLSIPYTGEIPGCAEPYCYCHNFTSSTVPEEDYEDLISQIDLELQEDGRLPVDLYVFDFSRRESEEEEEEIVY